MKILVFTEGTILMHLSGKNVAREERVKQSQAEGIQREKRKIAYDTNVQPSDAEKGSVYDLASYIPIGNAVDKILRWEEQGATICYLTSRRIKSEIETIRQVLKEHNFPSASNLFYRQQGEDYRDVVERIMPDILVEDDCESIRGEKEMTYPSLSKESQGRIRSVVVREFEGIDHLSDEVG